MNVVLRRSRTIRLRAANVRAARLRAARLHAARFRLILCVAVASLLPLAVRPPEAAAQRAPARAADLRERPLTLEQAIAEALSGNATFQITRAQRREAEAAASGALSPLLPQLGVETGYVRSIDPVFAFGTKLRQGTFGQTDFAVDVLNDPNPIGDWRTAARVSWDLVNPSAWAGRAAAGHRASGAAWTERRAREATVTQTRVLYVEALRAAAHQDAAVAAERAARSTRDLFAARVERGVLTRAELLEAEADLAAAHARQIAAGHRRTTARQRLGLFLGWEPDVLPTPSETLDASSDHSAGPAGGVGVGFDPARRADLRALASAAQAARAEKTGTGLAYLPEIGAFADYALHGVDAFGSDGTDWTVGIALRWSLFSGLGRQEAHRRASARAFIAETRYRAALRQASAEETRAERDLESTGERVLATAAADTAASVARDLMRRRFEEGLATATDVLGAEARAAAMRGAAIDALADLREAEARLHFVRSTSEGDRP